MISTQKPKLSRENILIEMKEKKLIQVDGKYLDSYVLGSGNQPSAILWTNQRPGSSQFPPPCTLPLTLTLEKSLNITGR